MNLDDMDGVEAPDPAKAPKVERPKLKIERERLQKIAQNWRKRKGAENSYASALEAVAKGESFAREGEKRHDIIRDLTWFLAKELRDVDPESLAECFRPSLEVTGRVTVEEVAAAFRSALRKRFEGEATPGRPVLMVNGLAETTDAASASLSRDAGLWQRNGELVRLVHLSADVFEPGRAEPTLRAGTPQTADVDRAHLAYRLDALSTWLKPGEEGCIPTNPPDNVVAAVASLKGYPVPVLAGVCETPIVRVDGTIVTEPGFDRESGWYYAGALDVRVPECPTLEDARRAMMALCEPFWEFPFTSYAAGMVPIAAILTILARAAIDGPTPGIMLDAAQKHTGKTYVAHLISLIVSGRKAGMAGFPNSDEELEKRLCTYAHASASLIVFDDQEHSIPVSGASLNRVLTAEDTVEFRVLGQNDKTTKLPWRALIVATGNNMQIKGDTTRRVLHARQESPCENPGDRKFRIPDVLGWTLGNRARLLGAAYTLLRAHAMAGFPGRSFDESVKGFFPKWSARVAKAIYWASGSGVNVLDCRILNEKEDGRNDLVVLFEVIEKLSGPNRDLWVRSHDIVGYVSPHESTNGVTALFERAGEREAIENLLAGKPLSAVSLGYVLKRKVGVVVAEKRLEINSTKLGNQYRVSRVLKSP